MDCWFLRIFHTSLGFNLCKEFELKSSRSLSVTPLKAIFQMVFRKLSYSSMFITELIFIFLLHEAALLPYERCTDFIVKENWDYREDDSGERSIQPTDADCCAQCSENEDCNAFTWVQDSSECWFHSTISDGRSSNLTIYTGYRRGKGHSQEKS